MCEDLCKGEIMLKFISHNETETKELARKLAQKLNMGDIIVLSRRFRVW